MVLGLGIALGVQLVCVMPSAADERAVWVFTATEGSRHESIDVGAELVKRLGKEQGFPVVVVEDPADLESVSRDSVASLVWMNASGNTLGGPARNAVRGFVEAGGGFVGVHAAAAAETDWEWFGELLGGHARFREHPPVQSVTLNVRTPDHPSVRHLPASFAFIDEWYVFERLPGPGVHRLLDLDPSELRGTTMRPHHPVAWCHQVGRGRAWYTALGHRIETYDDPRFVAHLAGGLQWASRFEGSTKSQLDSESESESDGRVGAALLVGLGALAVVGAWTWRRE